MTFIGSISGGTGGTSTSSISFTPGSGISGLASGMNTDAMVSGLVGAAQVPLIQMLQQRQTLQWQETRMQQVNASLATLQNSVQSMTLQSSFLQNQTTSSNSSVVSATAGTLVPQGTYNVTVQQLAQGSTVFSSTPVSTTDTSYPADTSLSSLGYGSGVTLNINGQALTFQGTDTLQGVLSQISSNAATGVSGFYDSSSNRFVFQTTGTGSQAMINVDSATTAAFFNSAFNVQNAPSLTGTANLSGTTGLATPATIEINGQKMTVSGTLQSIEGTINQSSSTTGVTATDNGTNLILQSTSTSSTGTSNQLMSLISVSDPTNALGLGTPYTGSTVQQVSQDAAYTVNGFSETSSSNQASYNGLKLNLQSTSASPVQINVSPDASAIAKSVTSFVQQYNQTLQLMQGLYNEKRNYNYPPLTTQQAQQLNQTQIDQWNEKAQSGMLENNPMLGSMMNKLESDMQGFVSGQPSATINGTSTTMNSLSAIGITPIDPLSGVSSGAQAPGVTTSGWNTYGLLQIDPTKLQAAIQANPQAVMQLFTNNPALPGANPSVGTGIAVQLNADLTNTVTQLTQQAGSNPNVNDSVQTTLASGVIVSGAGMMQASPIDPNADFTGLFGTDSMNVSFMGQQLSSIDSQATNMQQQLTALKQRYQTEFTQMEQSLSQLNSQSGGMMSMLGGGSSSSGSSSSGG